MITSRDCKELEGLGCFQVGIHIIQGSLQEKFSHELVTTFRPRTPCSGPLITAEQPTSFITKTPR